MANIELEKYVAVSRADGVSDELIQQELLKAGWNAEDVNTALGFTTASSPETLDVQPPEQDFVRPDIAPRKPWILIGVAALVIAVGTFASNWYISTFRTPQKNLEVNNQISSEPVQAGQNTISSVTATTTVAATATTSPRMKDCGSSYDCMIEAAKTCQKAKVDITTTVDLSKIFGVPDSSKEPHVIQTQRSISEIRGLIDGKCVYYGKLLDVKNPAIPQEALDAVIGHETLCSYDSADLVARLKNVQAGNLSGSFSTGDTPEEQAKKECQYFGASPGSVEFLYGN